MATRWLISWRMLPGTLASVTFEFDIGNVAHQGKFWPTLVSNDTRRMAAKLCTAVKQSLGPHTRGLSNKTLYEGLWQEVKPHLHKTSFHFWESSKISPTIRRQVVKASALRSRWLLSLLTPRSRSRVSVAVTGTQYCPI